MTLRLYSRRGLKSLLLLEITVECLGLLVIVRLPRLSQLIFQEYNSPLEIVDFLHQVLYQYLFLLRFPPQLFALLPRLLIAGHHSKLRWLVIRGSFKPEVSAVCLMYLNVLSEDRAPAVAVGQTLQRRQVAKFVMLQHVQIERLIMTPVGRMRAGKELEMQS